jgi:hypothetical protein
LNYSLFIPIETHNKKQTQERGKKLNI